MAKASASPIRMATDAFPPAPLCATSPYVNDTLLTYHIAEFQAPPFDYADAVEEIVAGDALASLPVAGSFQRSGLSTIGSFFTGLTRDDVGALRYQLHPNNYAVESLLPTVALGQIQNGGGWQFYVGTNTTSTNIITVTGSNFITTGLRGGRNHYTFKQVKYDSLLGASFTPITNAYTDVVYTNSTQVVQQVQRGILQPDIVFVVENLGLSVDNLTPFFTRRTDTSVWIDNDALNGLDETALSHGPGVIPPQVRISFTDRLPYFLNDNLDNEQPGETDAFKSFVWGKFDGSTNPPIVFPVNTLYSLPQLRQQLANPAAGR